MLFRSSDTLTFIILGTLVFILFVVLIALCIVHNRKNKRISMRWVKIYDNKESSPLNIYYSYELYSYQDPFIEFFKVNPYHGIWDMNYSIGKTNRQTNQVEFHHYFNSSSKTPLKCTFYKKYNGHAKVSVVYQFHSPAIINDFLNSIPDIDLSELKTKYPEIYVYMTVIAKNEIGRAHV